MAAISALFVCTANICRSPYLERRALAMAAERGGEISVSSAGTHGHHQEPMDPPMAAELERRGISPDGFASRRLTAAMLRDADVVLTAEHTHRRLILRDHPGLFTKVFTVGQFAEIVDHLPGGVPTTAREAIRLAGLHRVHDAAELDIVDPYARGASAAEECAAHIDKLLERILPSLLDQVS